MAEHVDNILEKALSYLQKHDRNIILKEEQEKAVVKLLHGSDVLAILPTGFGKSLIFTIFGLTKKIQEENSSVIVISPLRSLIADQLSELQSIECSAAELTGESFQFLLENPPLFIYSSAEQALDPRFMKAVKEGKLNISVVVVDESHTVETWTGKRKNRNNQPFREAYGKLAVLRSMCKKGVPLLALTGTADSRTQTTIVSELVMKSPTMIFVSPNRKNLKFTTSKVKKHEMLSQLNWIVDMVKDRGIDTPKTIIFCPTLNAIASLMNYLMLKLGDSAFHPPTSKKRENCVIGIFHSLTFDQYKERVSQSLKSNGAKRVVLATTALSMGVNFPDIRFIVLWGPPRTLLDFHQEVGRAGRDGLKSNAILYYYGQQVAHCDEDVRSFLKYEGCRRVGAYVSLDPHISPLKPSHDCCSVCSDACSCTPAGCVSEGPVHAKYMKNSTTSNPVKTRKVSEEDREILVEALQEIKDGLNSTVQIKAIGCTAVHGFSGALIEDVAENCHLIFTLEDLCTYAPVFSFSHAFKIMEVLNDLFGDCQETDLDSEDGDMPPFHNLSMSEYHIELWDEDEEDCS